MPAIQWTSLALLLLVFPLGIMCEGVCPQGPYLPKNCNIQHDCERWAFCYNGYCCNTTAFEHPDHECVDLRDDCEQHKDQCWQDATRVEFFQKCYKTCGYCKSDCIDGTDPRACAFFNGACESTAPIMHRALYHDCKRYCGFCALPNPLH
uniref:ShKT domain-containing protein n=1 Tax=Steinernema glaseri TaxID=37863 RepID=A0A1I8ABJ0_9BILA